MCMYVYVCMCMYMCVNCNSQRMDAWLHDRFDKPQPELHRKKKTPALNPKVTNL